MRFKIDHAQPTTSINHRYTEVSYDGNADSVLGVPAHWHMNHTEHMTVISGRVRFTLDGVTHTVTPESPTLVIPPWHTHSVSGIAGEPVVFREATDPTGDFKEVFFRDFVRDGQPTNLFHVVRAGYDGDMYPALPGGVKMVDRAFVSVLGGLTKVVGLGWRAMGWDPGWMLPLQQ